MHILLNNWQWRVVLNQFQHSSQFRDIRLNAASILPRLARLMGLNQLFLACLHRRSIGLVRCKCVHVHIECNTQGYRWFVTLLHQYQK